MSQFPFLPMYIGDMVADTEHLTNEEFGAYHRLLYAMWQRGGSVPDSDKDLARICHVWRRRWPYIKHRLMPFLTTTETGELTQKRLKKEFKRACTKKDQKSPQPLQVVLNENKDLDILSRARDSTVRNNTLSWTAPSFHASDLFDVTAPAALGALGCNGRAPSPPIPKETRAPPSALVQMLVKQGLKKSH